jgi:putative hydrolase of the HAD superfamily
MKAWLFDLGNTLMSIPDEYDEEKRLQELLNAKSMDDIRSIIYKICDAYPKQSIQQFIDRFNITVNPQSDRDIKNRIEQIWYESVENAVLKPFAWELLDVLRSAGIKLGLVSNTPPTSRIILEKLQLINRFDVVVFSCDVGFLKPDPRIFSIALEALDTAPDQSVIVGDKIRTDILGGAVLGMKSVLVEERLRCTIENGQNYVDAIVPNLHDLINTNFFERYHK